MATRGFSVHLFMPQGEPQGLRLIEKTNWTGVGIVFPRTRVVEAVKRGELRRTGVYVLWNDAASTKTPTYVGQSENVARRIGQHDKDEKMDWWTRVAAFTTKDDAFNQAHVRWLEWALAQRGVASARCDLRNGNQPSKPSISESDGVDAEHFLSDLLQCLPIVGVHAFEQPGASAPVFESSETFVEMTIDYTNSKTDRVRGVLARGHESVDGFVIHEGSLAAKDEAPSFADNFPGDSLHRAQLVAEGILIPDDQLKNAYRFTQDLECGSPSRAAGIVRGVASNGRENWKDAGGRSLNDLATLNAEPDDE